MRAESPSVANGKEILHLRSEGRGVREEERLAEPFEPKLWILLRLVEGAVEQGHGDLRLGVMHAYYFRHG